MNLLGVLMILLAPPPAAISTFAVENVTVEIGNGTRLEKATVVVEKGRITGIGARSKLPAKIKRIDGSGKVLAPGFIASWSVLGLREVSMVDSTRDYQLEGRAVSPAFRATDGFNPLSVRIPIAREEGVTSAIAAPGGLLLYGVGGWFELTGSMDTDPQQVAMYGGVGESALAAVGSSRGGVWLKMRMIFADVRHYRLNKKAYDKGESRPLSLAPIHLEALFPVIDGKLPLVLVANRASDIRTAVRFAKEQNIRLIIAGGAESWLVARELAESKVPVMVTPSLQGPESFETLRARDDTAALLARHGVRLILYSDSWITRTRQEAGIAVAHGLDHPAALRAITLTPAEVFGKGKELGSIERGKRANLVLWSGDPLELSSFAERVWIDGVEQSLDTRQRQLVRRYLEK